MRGEDGGVRRWRMRKGRKLCCCSAPPISLSNLKMLLRQQHAEGVSQSQQNARLTIFFCKCNGGIFALKVHVAGSLTGKGIGTRSPAHERVNPPVFLLETQLPRIAGHGSRRVLACALGRPVDVNLALELIFRSPCQNTNLPGRLGARQQHRGRGPRGHPQKGRGCASQHQAEFGFD